MKNVIFSYRSYIFSTFIELITKHLRIWHFYISFSIILHIWHFYILFSIILILMKHRITSFHFWVFTPISHSITVLLFSLAQPKFPGLSLHIPYSLSFFSFSSMNSKQSLSLNPTRSVEHLWTKTLHYWLSVLVLFRKLPSTHFRLRTTLPFIDFIKKFKTSLQFQSPKAIATRYKDTLRKEWEWWYRLPRWESVRKP